LGREEGREKESARVREREGGKEGAHQIYTKVIADGTKG